MIGRLSALGFVAGVVATHLLAELPAAHNVLWVAAPAAWLVARAWRRRRVISGQGPVQNPSPDSGREGGGAATLATLCLICLAACLGFSWTVLQAQGRLAEVLVELNVDRVTWVELRVIGLPRLDPDRRQFEAEVLSAHPEGVPRRILVGWNAPGWRGPYAPPQITEFPMLAPGQVWRMALLTRPVRAALNPHSFDYERHAFAQGLRATGTVRGVPELLRDESWVSLEVLAQRARHVVREAMRPTLEDMRYGPVLLALAIGDQDGVADEDWRVFNRTGITHLVSISGSHITMIAAFGGLAAYAVWRRLRWRGKVLAEYLPAQIAAAWAALLLAWLYCLLAGWGVPARRTFMMLAVVAGGHALRLRLGGSRVLALAAFMVLILDPWAVLASGFWLSFGAVAVLLAVSAKVLDDTAQARLRDAKMNEAEVALSTDAGWLNTALAVRLRSILSLAVRAQMAVTLALMPPLAWLFHEVSVVSPVVNAYAIPVIGWIVTPLSLLSAACAFLPGGAWLSESFAGLAHGALSFMMRPTEWLGTLPAAHWTVAAAPAILSLVACVGVALALWPTGWRARRLGWLAMLPLLFWPPARPAHGEWELYALDVGQGSALVLHTTHHTVVFDAGPRRSASRDEGARTVLPFLRAQGVRKLDVLIVSHGDIDHAGGVRSLLQGLPVEQSYSSFPLGPWLAREAHKLRAQPPPMPLADVPCRFGASWRVDGVSFEFLWPLADTERGRHNPSANASSCVLRVRGAHHSLLLTGDVEARSEAVMLERGLEPVDLVVAAHHGSATSSTQAWVDRLGASHVIAQAGAWNRHGHPVPKVAERWRQSGARFWRTDLEGAIVARSRAGELLLYSALESSRRYWHGRRQ